MTVHSSSSRHGGIVVETAIILTVIALLVAIAFPMYRGNPDASSLAQAQRDIDTLARAQIRAADTLGYYVPLQLLDDLALTGDERTAQADVIANESPDLKLIDPSHPAAEQASAQTTLADLKGIADDWDGPYGETKRVYLGESGKDFDTTLITAESVRRDYPLDPWGQPYRLYSPIGIVGSRAAETDAAALESDEFSDGALTTEDDRFDAYALVSYGPNGESDSVTETNDDIIYIFENTAEAASEGEAPEA